MMRPAWPAAVVIEIESVCSTRQTPKSLMHILSIGIDRSID